MLEKDARNELISAFSEEEEWRIFRLDIESPKTSAQYMVTPEFRAAHGTIIPYTEIELPKGASSPIRKIVLGYQLDEELSRESLRDLLRKAGLPLDLEIFKSNVPVRGAG